jgi:hypothetical protein
MPPKSSDLFRLDTSAPMIDRAARPGVNSTSSKLTHAFGPASDPRLTVHFRPCHLSRDHDLQPLCRGNWHMRRCSWPAAVFQRDKASAAAGAHPGAQGTSRFKPSSDCHASQVTAHLLGEAGIPAVPSGSMSKASAGPVVPPTLPSLLPVLEPRVRKVDEEKISSHASSGSHLHQYHR